MVKIETQCSRPDLKQHEKRPANSQTEKLSIFEAGISGGKRSLVRFGPKHARFCRESREKFEFSI